MPSYTARELERDTGVDRRTIAYYVQEGLLPKVGRRGPRTRYPKLVRDRLLFIRRVREAEEEGEVPAVSLSDMRKVFERVPPALIAGVADGRIAVSPELVAEPSTAFRAPGMRRRSLEERWGGPSVQRESDVPPVFLQLPQGPAGEPDEGVGEDVPRESSPGVWPEGMVADRAAAYEQEADLADSLLHLHEVASRRNEDSPRSRNTWTRIEISRDIVLSVRGITEEDEEVVERVRRAMAKVLG